ncbi:MAG TPA: glycoside hydrolase family 2 TIM barrel-domain containing protein [Bacteroidales bacterium]|nr:glycoside hydrolase family 2 TIM barrel-domain containing protein [Bacteroidales bacterium]HPF01716.1 glycoside hydrolase family 2 TIM barrel-domain containing protein [Bacteroidales bacterium]HPR12412.1 glycoside hydrolase family 2 TIM barrel-domain containing protein [Bacteroidales bacterium]
MKSLSAYTFLFLMCILLIPVQDISGQQHERVIENFNYGWKFHKGEIAGAHDITFNDSGWRDLDLPHDWSIEGPFSRDNSSCTAYLPGGTGWYRKSFTLPSEGRGRKVFIYFDGVYNNSEVWINGHFLGKRPNGYISFVYDLSPHLNPGGENVIAVKVDHTLDADSRWYTGSGIYRDVHLIYTGLVHAKWWGVSYTTPDVSADGASLSVKTDIVNESGKKARVKVTWKLMREKSLIVSSSAASVISAGGETTVSRIINVPDPDLWNVDSPDLYSLVTEIKSGKTIDRIDIPVGFRTIRFDADSGFFLNGKNLKLKGICMHHDAGALGAAVPGEELARRLDILKEMGCNAIRTSHNPFSPGFMDLCDKKGFLVIGEIFDEWELPKKKWLQGWNVGTPGREGYAEYFKEWAKQDLEDFVLRDRNHPSLIMWSIGNEVDYPNDPYTHPILNTEANPQTWAKFSESLPHADRLGEVARELVSVIKRLDTTRPVTAGLASALMSNETGYAAALDVAGYNYQEFRYEQDHRKYPDRPLYGSENGMTLEMWNYVADNDYIMGQFLWTGFEYLGEAGRYPMRSNTAGVIDLAGNKKPEFFFRQSLWSDKPMVFIGTTDRLDERRKPGLWDHKRVDPVWNYERGKMVSVNAFSNCEEVELLLNEKSLGTKKMVDFPNRAISWELPFEKGELTAISKNGGKEVARHSLRTTGEAARISAAVRESILRADRTDISHIFVTLQDKDGNVVYDAGNEVTCEISGPARLIGMEDSNPANTEDYRDNRQHAFHGRLLVYVQAEDKEGKVTIKLTSPGLTDAVVELTAKK